MTACPCAQEMLAGRSRERLLADGFTDEQIERDLRGGPGRDPQPARDRLAAPRPPRGRRGRDRRARPAAHRRVVDELGDLRADEALRRGRRRRARPPQPPLRRGRRARDDPPGRRDATRSYATAASSSRARRTSRRSTATRSSPSAPASSPRSSPSSRPASTRAHHVTQREWLEAPCSSAS